MASASNDCTIRLWSSATGECLKVLTGGDSIFYSVAWSPDGSLIATGEGDRPYEERQILVQDLPLLERK